MTSDGNKMEGHTVDTQTTTNQAETTFDIRHLTEAQLMQLGVSQLAYVKQIVMNGTVAYAIHGADGSPMAIAPEQDVALAAIREHEMFPALVH